MFTRRQFLEDSIRGATAALAAPAFAAPAAEPKKASANERLSVAVFVAVGAVVVLLTNGHFRFAAADSGQDLLKTSGIRDGTSLVD